MPIVAEYAKSNRSSCKACSKAIASKTLRVGLISKGPGGFDMTRWHHLECFPADSVSIDSVDDVKGLSALEVRVSHPKVLPFFFFLLIKYYLVLFCANAFV